MADYLVLEEDGTSRLELEETSDDFITEESSPHERSVALGSVAELGAAPEGIVVPPTYATWKVGTLTVPSSPGSVAVTGLEGTPNAVFFFGTNWLTEDTAVTTTGLGLFRGMAAPQWDDPGTIVQGAACAISAPSGNAHRLSNDRIINQYDTSGTQSWLYAATFTSFDGDGFTVNFDIAAAGGYKVVYVALLGVTDCVARSAMFDGTTVSLGFKAGSSLLHGAWAGTAVAGADRTQEFYGGAGYPGTTSTAWEGGGATVFSFPTSQGGQYVNELTANAPTTRVATGGHFTGPFLTTSNIQAYPSGTGLTSFRMAGDVSDGGMCVIWDDEDSRIRRVTPATSTGGTVAVTNLPFAPGLLIGYTISNEPDGQGTGGRGAIGLSVVTPEFQWCATVDGTGVGSFQSFQRGFADAVSGSSVHAGTVELTNDGFVLTTEEDDTTRDDTLWHAFGHPEQVVLWIPRHSQLVAAHALNAKETSHE